MNLLSALTALLYATHTVMADCYFPVEMQGEFMTQWKESQDIAYTSISLTYNSVPSWGICHSRHKDNVILRDTNSRTGSECFRCIRIRQRSINVNQVHVRDLNQCYDSEAEAMASCPTEVEVTQRSVEEIMLYKTRGFYGESAVTQIHCPFNGRWKFAYNNAADKSAGSCASEQSEAGGCPSEYMIDLKFRNCDFPDFDMSFQCLGHWQGEDGLNYLSLLDTKLPQLGEEPRPRYRCAVYESDLHTGVTYLALSNDSTCVNQLTDHLTGYETLRLERKNHKQPTPELSQQRFPAWSQGDWGKLKIRGSELIYQNSEELTTYHADALISPGNGKMLAKISTACGDLGYACVALEKRTSNILEMKIGKIDATLDVSLCSDAEYMDAQPWVAVGKEVIRTPCPLSGNFHGVIPDAEGLCARSRTSCQRPDQMEYQVYNCENSTEVYEDRLYQCYGQFKDDRDGLVYTLTQRLDLPHQECFVGTSDERQHFVMEAGAHCARGKAPRDNGMVMKKESETQCNVLDAIPSISDNLYNDLTANRPVSPRLTPSLRPHQNVEHKHHGHHGGHHNGNHHAQAVPVQQQEPAADNQPPAGSGSQNVTCSSIILLLAAASMLKFL